MPGGKEKRRQICRKGEKEMTGEFEGRENEKAGGGGRWGIKWLREREPYSFVFFPPSFLAPSHFGWFPPSVLFLESVTRQNVRAERMQPDITAV